jgi:SAM-dependent methyltransferase
MLARGASLAEQHELGEKVRTMEADFNRWEPEITYDGILANQSLHHVLELEHLLDSVAKALAPGALFLTSDMIGRNGHQRWPEALAIVEEFWDEVPAKYRYNHQARRQEDIFVNVDCSHEGFEGIRAQDILPLLVERFAFDAFVPFANVIDPFIDRGFGHNFDASSEWDRAFIDRVHARDEAELARGRITPTHLIAAMCVGRKGESRYVGGRAPAQCIRRP